MKTVLFLCGFAERGSKILNNSDQEDPENIEDLLLERLFEAPDTDLDTLKYHQEETQIISDQDLPNQLETLRESEQLLELHPAGVVMKGGDCVIYRTIFK